MLKLRPQHLAAFEAHVVNQFTARVLAHVRAVWAAECEGLGEAAIGELVREGIKRAAALGLTSEQDIVRYVDLTFILVKDFETNPLSMWTRPILADRSLAPSAKLDKLYQGMEQQFTFIEKRKGGSA